VKTEIVKICAAVAGILALAAAQDLFPSSFGTKPPLLLVFGCIAGVPAAVAAGLFADALGGLPFGCSAAFFLAAALLTRFLKSFSFPVAIVSAAMYQIWLLLWGGNVPLHTIYAAVIYAAILFPAMRMVMSSVKLHTGIDMRGKEGAR
jgi:hypothetical protein